MFTKRITKNWLLAFFIAGIILSSGCVFDKEFTDDELISIATNNPEVVSLINNSDYKVTGSGPVKMNGVDIYSVKISVTNEQGKKRAYQVLIDKSGYVMMVKNEFGTIDSATVVIGIKNNSIAS